MSKRDDLMTVDWDDYNEYEFRILHRQREMRNADGFKDHYKSVYKGFFLGEAPEGVEPNVVCWLKVVEFSEETAYPQLREQYDLVEFPEEQAPRIRRPLARNAEAVRIARELKKGKDPRLSNRLCYMVERSYSELTPEDIRYLTPWERLEYMDQYCAALEELYEVSPHVYGWAVEAHRDVKLGNGLILREKDRFRVKLLDFSSIRFERDPEYAQLPRPVYVSAEGGQNTKPLTMSDENTCLEIVSSGYPTTRRADVYALGAMLAGMFGHVLPGYRNPNTCVVTRANKNRGEARPSLEPKDIEHRLLTWLQKDKKLGASYPGTTWMEELLSRIGTPFTWGDPAESPYELDRELLDQVKELFFDATRIDPADRIDMDEFHDRVHRLKNWLQKRTGKQTSRSSKLYLQPECVYVLHQRDMLEHRHLLKQAAAQAMEQEDGFLPVQLCWYQNKEDGLFSKEAQIERKCIESVSELNTTIAVREDRAEVPAKNLVHMICKIWEMYSKYRYEKSFSGTIHIFSVEPILQEHFGRVRSRGELYTFDDFLGNLSELSDGALRVRFHAPAEPEYQKENASFAYFPLPGYEAEAPEPKPEPFLDPIQAFEFKPESEPRPEPEPEPDPAPDPAQYYLRGAESLFILTEDGRKIYVTRKKIRR